MAKMSEDQENSVDIPDNEIERDGEESKTLDQDAISKLLEEVQAKYEKDDQGDNEASGDGGDDKKDPQGVIPSDEADDKGGVNEEDSIDGDDKKAGDEDMVKSSDGEEGPETGEDKDAAKDQDETEEVGDDKEPGEEDDEEEDLDDEDSGKTGRSKNPLFIAVGSIAVLALLLFSFYIFKDKHVSLSSKQIEGLESGPDIEKPHPLEEIFTPAPPSPMEQKLNKASDMLMVLQDKQKAIIDLQRYYREAIDEVEQQVLEELYGRETLIYEDALKEKRIELYLRTIQRRQSYIHELDQILEKLILGTEQMRYQKRRVEIDMLVVDFIDGMAMNILLEYMDKIIQQHIHDGDMLNMKGVKPQSLKIIWTALCKKNEKARKTLEYPSGEDRITREIREEICNGNFERKYKLKVLSTMTAKCLSKWEGEHLFLGNLTMLPPAAAGFLAQWKGKWLSLNGLTNLSPDVAMYLSQWQGDRLSLNGLKSLSPSEAKYLSNRHGKELELADLTRISPNAKKHLINWVKSGGKIYGTDKF